MELGQVRRCLFIYLDLCEENKLEFFVFAVCRQKNMSDVKMFWTLTIFHFFGLFIVLAHANPPPSCGLYGQPPCQFIPARSGCTPTCVKPGLTYCENVKDYPG